MRRSYLAGLALVLLAPPAAAFPLFDLRPTGTPFEGPAEIEPTASWWNPAALAPLRGFHLQFFGGLRARRGTFDRTAIDHTTGLPGPGADRTFPALALDDDSLRYFAAASWDFGLDYFAFGLSVSAPWNSTLGFSDDGSGNSLKLPAAYHLASESFHSLFISLAVALHLHPRFAIGLAVMPIDSWADLTLYRDRALDQGSAGMSQPSGLCGATACGFENPLAATRIQLHGDGGVFWNRGGSPGLPWPLGLGLEWGILIRPIDPLFVGLSYLHVYPFGGSGSGYERSYELPSQRGATVAGTSGAGTLALALPDILQAGVRILLLPDKLELSGWARLVMYGGYGTSNDPAIAGLVLRLDGSAATAAGTEKLVLARGLRPALALEAGARWRPWRWLRLGLSEIVETSAIPAGYVNPEAFDALKFDTTLGAEFRIRSWLRLVLAYGLTAFLPASVNPSAFDPGARLRCVDAQFATTACADDLAGRGLPTAAGRYSGITHHATAGVGLDF